jgi:hypothetical protein
MDAKRASQALCRSQQRPSDRTNPRNKSNRPPPINHLVSHHEDEADREGWGGVAFLGEICKNESCAPAHAKRLELWRGVRRRQPLRPQPVSTTPPFNPSKVPFGQHIGVRSRHIVLNTTAGTGREEKPVATVPDILITAVAGQFASHLRYRANFGSIGVQFSLVNTMQQGIDEWSRLSN